MLKNNVDEEDLELQATRRARARNVQRIPKSVLVRKILVPSRRYATLFAYEQADRFAAGLDPLPARTTNTTTTNVHA